MSIQTEITRINGARDKLRSKAVELGIGNGNDKLDVLADKYSKIEDQGAVSATVQAGDTYTIPKGYHNGSGTVSATDGSDNYKLQSKQITPTKSQQNVTPDDGFYGLSDVTVKAIPVQYQDVSSVNAAAGDVLSGKMIVTSDGTLTAGTMSNNGAVNKTLDTTTKSFTIPQGYHSGTGAVKVVTEEKTATPTKAPQDIAPTAGKVLSKVTVEAIPAEYVDTTDATAVAADILDGKTAYAGGQKVEGTMTNNGDTSGTFDGLASTSYSVPAGYTTGGTVSLTSDIEDALSAI